MHNLSIVQTEQRCKKLSIKLSIGVENLHSYIQS